MKLWINRRLWRCWLLLFWLVFKVNTTQKTLSLVINNKLSPAILTTNLEDFLLNNLTGWYLNNYNSCWHRTILTIKMMQTLKKRGIIKIGGGHNIDGWHLHIWVEDQNGAIISDPIPEELPFKSFLELPFQ